MGKGRAGWKEVAKQAICDLWLKYKHLLIKLTTNGESPV